MDSKIDEETYVSHFTEELQKYTDTLSEESVDKICNEICDAQIGDVITVNNMPAKVVNITEEGGRNLLPLLH